MAMSKVYTGTDLVETYDHRHFGGDSGQYLFQQDLAALEYLLGSQQGWVLDVPCGTGLYSDRLQSLGYRIVAADASMPMLELAGQRSGDLARILCDINHLPFRDGAIASVMTIRLFQHYPREDVVRILHELGRAIKPGGRIVFDTFRWTPRRWLLFRRFLEKTEMYVFSHRDVKGMIRAAKLRKAREISLHLFSPIWQRKLPLWVLQALTALEAILPRRWLLRTFWACTKD